MEPEAATILPKGIVHNTKEIYDEVAKHPIVPMDRVWQIWRGEQPLLDLPITSPF